MSKEYSRTQRVNQLLKEEISALLVRDEVKDVRIGRVTITDVEASPDLAVAKVYVQSPGDEDRKRESLEGLNSAAGFIRSRLGRDLHIRRVPELQFVVDETIERATRIEKLLREIRSSDSPGEGGDGG